MESAQTELRDRMLRDAIVEGLREDLDVAGRGDTISLVDAGFIGQLTVAGDRVRVDLAFPKNWSSFTGSLALEVQRRVQALPEVALTEVSVNVGGDPVAEGMLGR